MFVGVSYHVFRFACFFLFFSGSLFFFLFPFSLFGDLVYSIYCYFPGSARCLSGRVVMFLDIGPFSRARCFFDIMGEFERIPRTSSLFERCMYQEWF